VPPERILVVDDNESILLLVATILRIANYEVDTAGGGRDALSMIERTPYDLILLDLMMPEVSGLDVLESLNASTPRVKCVIIMSAASPAEIANATNENVFAVLRKPFNNSELVSAVRRCMEANCAPAPLDAVPTAGAVA
jgi:DNA-binding NtrC family response regulator